MPLRTSVVIVRSTSLAFDPRVMKVTTSLREAGFSVSAIGWHRETTTQLPVRNSGACATYLFGMKALVGSPLIAVLLPFWWFYVFAIALAKSGAILHACDLDSLPPAILLKLLARRKVVYDIFDFYADRLSEHSILRRMVVWLDKSLASLADAVILADDRRLNQVRGLKTRRMITVYNSPHKLDSTKKLTAIYVNCFTLFYCGTMDFRRGIIDVAKAVEPLSGVKLVVAGYTGPHYRALVSQIGHFRNSRFIGPLSYNEVLHLTQRADALLALYDPTWLNNRFASPNKLFEAMMCGKPIVVSDGTLMAGRVIEHDCGRVVRYGDVECIREAISCLKNDPALRSQLGENGKRAYDELYDWSIMKKRLIELYREISR